MPIDSQSAFPITNQGIPAQPGTPISSVGRALDPNNPPWGLGGALLVLIGSVLIQFAFSTLFLIPFVLQHGSAAEGYGEKAVQLALSDTTAIFFQVLAVVPSHVLAFGLVWMVVTRFGRLPFLASLGWGWFGRPRFWGSVGLGIALFIVASGIARLMGADKPTQLEQMINSSLAARYALAALAVLTAPFVEEFIYRGVVYSALQRLVGASPAVVIVVALFTLVHVPQYWPNFGVIAAIGLLSFALTFVRAYTGRLLPCIVIHLVFNGIQAVILLIEPHLPRPVPTPDQITALILSAARLACQFV